MSAGARSASPQGSCCAQPGEFPSVPDVKAEDFRHTVGLLKGFEEFLDLDPNAPALSFAFGLATAAAPIATSGTLNNKMLGAESSERSNAEQIERRQCRNRVSSRRFRGRQKVRAGSQRLGGPSCYT